MTASDFRIEVDCASESEWSADLIRFADASIYQSWAYGAVRWGTNGLSHLTLKRGTKTLAMAQLALAGPKMLRMGIAHLRGGPVWILKGAPAEGSILERMAEALHNEYVVRRGLFLRVLTGASAGTAQDDAYSRAFRQFKSVPFKPGESFRTFIVDLTPPLEQIRKGLDQKWRNQLNRAEKNELTIHEGKEQKDFVAFIKMHDEMLARKQFATSSDIHEFASMQQSLPSGQKLIVLICEHQGTPMAGLVGTGMGDSGRYLFGATTDQGMKAKGAYLLQWRMIQWLKAQGVTRYDLGGINPETNPGVYHFKAGLSGADVLYLPPFVGCTNLASEIFVRTANVASGRMRGLVQRLIRKR